MKEMMNRVRVLLLLSALVVSASVGAEEYVKYKDPKQPVALRIKDLMGRMTLEEKIGQMIQIDRTIATPQILNDYSIGMVNSIQIYILFFFTSLLTLEFGRW